MDSWRTGSKDRQGGESDGLYTPFGELGTCCVSECPAWTPHLQGKAFWFLVSSGPWKHYGKEAKHYSMLARVLPEYQCTWSSKFQNPSFYIISPIGLLVSSCEMSVHVCEFTFEKYDSLAYSFYVRIMLTHF